LGHGVLLGMILIPYDALVVKPDCVCFLAYILKFFSSDFFLVLIDCMLQFKYKTMWLQIGLENYSAESRTRHAGLGQVFFDWDSQQPHDMHGIHVTRVATTFCICVMLSMLSTRPTDWSSSAAADPWTGDVTSRLRAALLTTRRPLARACIMHFTTQCSSNMPVDHARS
jgi:hypothetical protein